MKKLFLALSLFLAGLSVQAQELDMMSVIPNDPEVRSGVLDNGATYYIRRNTKDPDRANFHILYKVGAVLEEDRQDGLAHFLEHMAFNGSKNFEGNELIEYCRSKGIEFGANLNAGTGQDMTTYMITNVPLSSEGVVDSMLLVLHDWAGFISLDHDDIDDERGIISEEWRMYEAMANTRLRRKSNEIVYGVDNIYNKRDIIGPLENIQGFDYQDIKDFYHKWYRPDLQAFVIVGDIDPEVIEAKLKAVMADVKAVENGAKAPKFKMEKHEEPRFGIFTDPEASQTSITLMCKLRPESKKYANTVMAAKTQLLNYFAGIMLNERLSEISKSADAAFLNAMVWKYSFNSTFDALYLGVGARPGETVEAFTAAFTELLRAVRGGYAIPELERAKAELLSQNEAQFNARGDRKNQHFVDQYNSNFFDNAPYPTAEYDYELSKALIEGITIEEVEAQIASLLTDENVVVYAYEKSGDDITNTDVADLEAAYNAVKASEIAPYVEEVVTRPLLDVEAIKAGKVAKTKEGMFETTEWTLKNGIKVVVKPTEHKADQILINGIRKGGTSKIESLEDLYSIGLLGNFGTYAGVSDFTATELSRALTGKQVYVAPYVSEKTEGFYAQSNIKDLETAFQLIYLQATAPRAERADWDVMMDKLHTQVEGSLHDPMRIFQDSITSTLFANNPRQLQLGEEYLSKVSYDAFKATYNGIFSNLYDMTFFFTGDIDMEVLKQLSEKYLGSLKTKKDKKLNKFGDLEPQIVKGDVVNRYSVPQESPQVIAVVVASGDVDFSMAENLNLRAAGDILQAMYTRTIREENSGVYVVQNAMQVDADPVQPKFINQTIYLTDSSKVFTLLPLVKAGVDYITTDGPTESELQEARLAMIKRHEDALRSNNSWADYVSSYYMWNIDYVTGYMDTLNAITVDSVKEAAKRAFSQGNRVELIQLP